MERKYSDNRNIMECKVDDITKNNIQEYSDNRDIMEYKVNFLCKNTSNRSRFHRYIFEDEFLICDSPGLRFTGC